MYPRTVYVQDLSTDAITSDTTVIYTVPSNTRAKWVLLYLHNSTGSSISGVTARVVNGSDVEVIAGKSLAAGGTIQLDSTGGYFMLEEGYKLKARANATGVSCIITVEEFNGTVVRNL